MEQGHDVGSLRRQNEKLEDRVDLTFLDIFKKTGAIQSSRFYQPV